MQEIMQGGGKVPSQKWKFKNILKSQITFWLQWEYVTLHKIGFSVTILP